MLLHLPIVIAATLSPVAVSNAVPNFDIVRECRLEGEFDRCSEDEGIALRQLQNTWTQFSGGDKKSCIASTTIGGFASYVELLICLQMTRDVENEEKDSRGPQTTEAIRAHASGVTIGTGHDPIMPEQVPGQDSR
jgi:hypothetical protein